jgi:hypothetical protein
MAAITPRIVGYVSAGSRASPATSYAAVRT